MHICPNCTHFLEANTTRTRDERICRNCGWTGIIFIENGKRFGRQDKLTERKSE